MYFHPKRYNIFSQQTVCFQFFPCREERLSDRWISVVKNKNVVACSQNCKELGFGTGIWEGKGRRFSARKIKLGSCCNLHMVQFKCSPKHPSIGSLLVPRTVTLGDHRTLKRWSLPRHAWVLGELPSEIVSGCDCVKAASLDRSASLSASISSVSFFRKDYGCGLLQTKFFCLTYQL